MINKKILIVEDEIDTAMQMKEALEKLGYILLNIASNYHEALKSSINNRPDIILLDINLKDEKNGIDIANDINLRNVLIIYITAMSEENILKKALNTNPINYLLKPIRIEQLVCTIELALFKKQQKDKLNKGLHYLGEGFYFDFDDDILYLEKHPIKLSTKEKELFKLLYSSKNSLVPMHIIEHTIWPDEPASDSSFRTLLYRLRRKLDHKLIENIPSLGYKINIAKARP